MKNILLFALAVVFVACGKDDDRQNLNHHVGRSYILYWDGQKLAVGQWGTVNQNNILYTKFGSLVAFTTTSNDDAWDAGDVKFSPTTAVYDDYQSIPWPHWDGSEQLDGFNAIKGYIIQQYYEFAGEEAVETNLVQGRGDICKLVGLTPAEAQARAANGTLDDYNSGFRLFTTGNYIKEMWREGGTTHTYLQPYSEYNFLWTTTPAPGRWLDFDPTANSFLSAAGGRNIDGTPHDVGTNGYYWTDQLANDLVDYGYLGGSLESIAGVTLGGQLFFDNTTVHTDLEDGRSGFAVRCSPIR
jgi:hypothetical protein